MSYKETEIDENHYIREYDDGQKLWYIDGDFIFGLYNGKIRFTYFKSNILTNKNFIFNNIYLLNKESK